MPSLAHHRLRKHADYQRVYKASRKQFSRQIAYFFALREEAAAAHCPTEGPRIGLTVPKALGNAVARNRIKRRLREAVRHALPLLSAPVDLVLHPRASVLEADFAALQAEVASIFRAVEAAGGRSIPPTPRSSAARKPPAKKPAPKPVAR